MEANSQTGAPRFQCYVIGFVFGPSRNRVLLVRKARPTWQAGRLNGIGGKVEFGEHPQAAMVRECEEETGLEIPFLDWTEVVSMLTPTSDLRFYAATSRCVDTYHRHEVDGEVVNRYRVEELAAEPLIDNLRWLLPLAQRAHEYAGFPIRLSAQHTEA